MSQLTFREKTDTCWQKLLRDRYLSEGTPDVPHLDVGRAIVRPITRHLAEQIILKYEWLGTMATGVNRFYGIFFGSYCAGVTTFAPAGYNLPSLAKSFNIDGSKLAYLGRGANVHWAPKGSNSKLIGYSLKFETKLGNKLAVAFSDTDAGEIGTVYQATNWIYIGVGSVWPQWVSPMGKIWSFNQFTKWCKTNHMTTPRGKMELIKLGWRVQRTNPKHRYVYILDRGDKQLADRVDRLKKPYPKRCGKGEIDSALQTNVETEGASPILPLYDDAILTIGGHGRG
jgi:hypothetical protein